MRLDPELAQVPLIPCTAAVRMINELETAEQLDRLGVEVYVENLFPSTIRRRAVRHLYGAYVINEARNPPSTL